MSYHSHPQFRIDLTHEEEALLGRIDFEAQGHKTFLSNREPVANLIDSLFGREAIPAHRREWWTNPELNTGSKKSRRDRFTENRRASSPHDIYTHPHFLKHLHYFVFGPNLPPDFIEMFNAWLASSPEPLSPADFYGGNDEFAKLGKVVALAARTAVREYGMRKLDAAEELCKLSLESGFDADTALSVRRFAMETRP